MRLNCVAIYISHLSTKIRCIIGQKEVKCGNFAIIVQKVLKTFGRLKNLFYLCIAFRS